MLVHSFSPGSHYYSALLLEIINRDYGDTVIIFTIFLPSEDSRQGGTLLDLGDSENKGRSQQSQMQIQMEQEQEMQALQERESQIRQLEVSVANCILCIKYM